MAYNYSNYSGTYQGSVISVSKEKLYNFLKANNQEDHPIVFDIDNSRYQNLSGFVEIALHSIHPDNLSKLIEIADDGTSVGRSNLLKIRRYQNIISSYKTKIPNNLPDFAEALREYVRNECFSYALTKLSAIPVFRRVISVTYSKGTREGEPSTVQVQMSYVSLNNRRADYITVYAEDLHSDSTIEEFLFKCGYRAMTKEDFDVYSKRYTLYKATFNKIGAQYTTLKDTIADVSGAYYVSRRIKLTTLSPLVIDPDPKFGDKIKVSVDSTEYFNVGSHADVKNFNTFNDCAIELFSLEDKESVVLNVDEIQPYQWNDKILDDIVLPETHRKCINILMSSHAADFSDVIRNKSKGIVVLASGVPGTGKTLSAQCWSEAMHKPLYVVQASELGISIDTIEANLRKIFDRIIRWDAVLCLDEVDAFVHRRDTDLLQNAIVGVFLRMLESFSGILFMTTNRFKDKDGQLFIDDAIVSRVSAHLVYTLPNVEDLSRILQIQASKMDITISDPDEISKFLYEKKCSGRDVRNFVKLSKMFISEEGRNNITLADIQEVMPFHATLSISETDSSHSKSYNPSQDFCAEYPHT